MMFWVRGFAVAACLGLLGGDGALAQSSSDTQEEETGIGRFKRAPFKTYNDTVGPRRPLKIEPIATESHPGARLRQLDKMTGGIKTVDVATSDQAQIGRLRVRVEACRTSDDTSKGGAIAFLKIWDQRNQSDVPDFSGWMFADSPALSAFDHPRYDVWVINCITASGEVDTGSE